MVCHKLMVMVGLLLASHWHRPGQQGEGKSHTEETHGSHGSQNMRTLEDWVNLERQALEKSCKAVKLLADGTLTDGKKLDALLQAT